MRIYNGYVAAVEVLLLVNNKPGGSKLVMPGIPEELSGPAFMVGQNGQPIPMLVSGEIHLSSCVNNPEKGVLLVRPNRVTDYQWTDTQGCLYRILAKDFRLAVSKPSR
jgi:hypothetical protein